MPRFVTGRGSEIFLSSAVHRAFLADLLRMIANTVSTRSVRRLVPGTDLAYERYGAFQSLGKTFQRPGIPWILETQGIDFHNRFKGSRTTAMAALLRRKEIGTYRSCDGIVCSTDDVKQEIVELTGIGPERLLILPNAVDSDFYDPARFSRDRQFDEFTIGFVGRLYPWQGVDLLLDALQLAKQSGAAAMHAVIVGDGVDRQRLEAMSARLGLRREVCFMGHVASHRVSELLMGCDVSYIGHQRSDKGRLPFSPIKLYESLSLGVPVVAPSEPPFTKVVRQGKTGFLFEPSDPRSLLESLLAAQSVKNRLEDMGRRARGDAVRYHSWTQRVETLLDWIVNERNLLRV